MPPIAALTLGSAWMLGWLAAVAIPITIHLWNRWRRDDVPWAAMQFLEAAVHNSRRRAWVDQWILLALRVLTLALLALALADPLLSTASSSSASGETGAKTHTVLVIDGSYSMAHTVAGRSRLDEAKLRAVQLVRDTAPGDAFTLVVMSDPPQLIVSEPSYQPAAVIAAIEGLEVSHGSADPRGTLAVVEQLLRSATQATPQLSQHVRLYTDLQENSWAHDLAATTSQLSVIAEHAAIRLVDVGTDEATNAYISRLDISDQRVTVNQQIEVLAEVVTVGDGTSRAAQFLVDGESIGERPIVESNGRAIARLQHTFRSPGNHVVEVRLPDDGLTLDNRSWLSIAVRDRFQVLCVEGKHDAARFVSTALSPTDGAIACDVISEHALSESRLEDYDTVFLCNVGRITRAQANRLRNYVANGGGLVIALGDQCDIESYNRQLDRPALRLLPARIGVVVPRGTFFFRSADNDHPIVRPFRDYPDSGLMTTPVWRYFTVDDVRDDATVVLAYTSGDPAIVAEQVGGGRVVLLTTPLSMHLDESPGEQPVAWNALASSPSFPPLIHELFRATPGGVLQANTLVGEQVGGRLDNRQEVSIRRPDGGRAAASLSREAGRWSYDRTDLSGVYLIGRPNGEDERFAVNLDTRESNLARFDIQRLPEEFRSNRSEGGDLLRPDNASRPLFRWLLGCVLSLMLCETWLGRSAR